MPFKDPEVQRKYLRERCARLRRDWLLANGPCVDCDSWDQLEVDHVDSKTKITHRVWTWTEERRSLELAKCVVRCHDCHVQKTGARQEYAHGTENGRSRISEEEVWLIRRSSESTRVLAKRFDIGQRHIQKIRSGEKWKHLS